MHILMVHIESYMAIKLYVDISSRYEEGDKVSINGGRKGEYRMYCIVPGIMQ